MKIFSRNNSADNVAETISITRKVKTRFILLDVARSVAAILVIVTHIAQTFNHPLGRRFGIPGYYVSLGGLAVTIFLILSGLVLELKYGTKKLQILKFFIKRCLRIYPVYWLCLLLGVTFFILFKTFQDTNIFTLISYFNLDNCIIAITGFYAFVGKWGGEFVPTSWFIGLIVTLYFLYPFLSPFIRKNPNKRIIILFFISVFFRFILGKYDLLSTRPLDWFPLCRIFEFSLGIYLAHKLPKNTWYILNSTIFNNSFITFISELSFPLFLVHSFLLPIIPIVGIYLNTFYSILIYLCLSLFLSQIILIIDRKIPRHLILKFLQ